MAEVDVITATISAGQSLSTEADIGSKSLVGIVIPAAWIAAAGGLSLQMSPDGGITWCEVRTISGSAYAIAYTSAGAASIEIDPTTLRGISALKIRSGTVGSPVNQTNTVILQLVTRLVF
jgi:hypothetical protein